MAKSTVKTEERGMFDKMVQKLNCQKLSNRFPLWRKASQNWYLDIVGFHFCAFDYLHWPDPKKIEGIVNVFIRPNEKYPLNVHFNERRRILTLADSLKKGDRISRFFGRLSVGESFFRNENIGVAKDIFDIASHAAFVGQGEVFSKIQSAKMATHKRTYSDLDEVTSALSPYFDSLERLGLRGFGRGQIGLLDRDSWSMSMNPLAYGLRKV